jgi:ABC-type amino acid transport substrate-binding protein
VIASPQSELSPPAKRTHTIGTKLSPPFVIKQADGSWSGISIELWKRIAVELGVNYTLREYDLKGLLSAAETGEIDAAVGALTITAARERVMDFTHPFYRTGFSVAVPEGSGSVWPALIKRFVSLEFVGILGLS